MQSSFETNSEDYSVKVVGSREYDFNLKATNPETALLKVITRICRRQCRSLYDLIPIEKSEIAVAYDCGYSWSEVLSEDGEPHYYKFALPLGF